MFTATLATGVPSIPCFISVIQQEARGEAKVVVYMNSSINNRRVLGPGAQRSLSVSRTQEFSKYVRTSIDLKQHKIQVLVQEAFFYPKYWKRQKSKRGLRLIRTYCNSSSNTRHLQVNSYTLDMVIRPVVVPRTEQTAGVYVGRRWRCASLVGRSLMVPYKRGFSSDEKYFGLLPASRQTSVL